MAASALPRPQVSPPKYPPGPTGAVGTVPHIPRPRGRITPAGWALLVELGVWALIITAAVRWL